MHWLGVEHSHLFNRRNESLFCLWLASLLGRLLRGQAARQKCASFRPGMKCWRWTGTRWQKWATQTGNLAWRRPCRRAAWSWTYADMEKTVSHSNNIRVCVHVCTCVRSVSHRLNYLTDSITYSACLAKQFWHFKLVCKWLWNHPWMSSWQQLKDLVFLVVDLSTMDCCCFPPCKFFLLPFSAFSFSTILFLFFLPLSFSPPSAFRCLCCVFLVEN